MNNIDIRFLRVAAIYLLVGMGLGIFMGIAGDHRLFPAHAHVNLVGWVSFALYGLVYRAYPSAARAMWARIHFWIANVGALLLSVGVFGINAGYEQFVPFAAAGGILNIVAAVIFTAILFAKASAPESEVTR